MNDVETFLARLFTDEALRTRFEHDRAETLRAEGFGEDEVTSLSAIDCAGLELSGQMYAKKLVHHEARNERALKTQRGFAGWWRRLSQRTPT